MKLDPASPLDLSVQISRAIRDAIMSGAIPVDRRLPSEADLADLFGVSRPTVREALKRLAAQSLIRTQRGATGGAFVNRLSYADAYGQHITTSTLLLSMNEVSFATACEARFALERACAHLAASRCTAESLAVMETEIARQGQPDLDDVAFCASDVTFHRALVDAAGNPVLSYQLAGAVEAMQPLMNMITFTARSRAEIIALHRAIVTALARHDGDKVWEVLSQLERQTLDLAARVFSARSATAKT